MKTKYIKITYFDSPYKKFIPQPKTKRAKNHGQRK